jgi:CRP/FNR family transcriptional regulator
MQQEDILEIQSRLNFWDKLTPKQQDTLLQASTTVHYDKGASLHNSESNCLGIILIKKGTLRAYMLSEEGREITLYRLDSGDVCIMSASCVLNDITFDVHLDADVDTDAILISSHVFSKVAQENVYAELFSYKVTAERFSDVMWAMQQILFISFDKRLATFLIDESIRNNTETLIMTHEQIARYMGSAREVVTRMLKYFSQEGLVSLSRGGISILDMKKLRALTNA